MTPTETVILYDGPEEQHLVPGVAPTAGQSFDQLMAERDRRHGNAPMPEGGLFDEAGQGDLF